MTAGSVTSAAEYRRGVVQKPESAASADTAATDSSGLAAGVLAGDRGSVGRAITLVESAKAADRAQAAALLDALTPHSGGAHRVGVSGAPGVGKSTLIETLGLRLTAAGHKVAVLAVDPSSTRSGGSILGDKTRMSGLSVDPAAFIRPTPAGGALGGVARATREAVTVLEAAGHDVVLIETVGVGQSETSVAGMVDFLLVLVQPGAGDELQGIKKGLMEAADMVAVNKADGATLQAARQAVLDYRRALSLTVPASADWTPPVVGCSALDGGGVDELWEQIEQHRRAMADSGERDRRRSAQAGQWMRAMLTDRLLDRFDADPQLRAARQAAEADVVAGRLAPSAAVDALMTRLEKAQQD